MSDLGFVPAYATVTTDVIYGTPDAGDPVARAALQDQYQRMNQALAGKTVPQTYMVQSGGPNPLGETAPGPVAGNLPQIGWTVQKNTGSPFGPYAPTKRAIDWTADTNPVGAGPYDANQVVASWAVNPLNRAPIGGFTELFEGAPNDGANPNAPNEDISGTIDLEW